MNKVLFQGYYGMQNTGDDAFVEVGAWGARKFWNIKSISYGYPNLPTIKTHCDNFEASNKKIIKGIQQLKSVLSSTHFVSAGGSIFHSCFSMRDIRRFSLVKKKMFPSYTIGAIGVSLGPFRDSDSEKYITGYLKKLDFLILRDRQSYVFASSLNLPYKPVQAFDLAALLPDVYGINDNFRKYEKKSKKIIGISLCNYESYIKGGDQTKEVARNRKLLELVLTLSKNQEYELRFFIFNGHENFGDKVLVQQVTTKLKQNGAINFKIIPYHSCVEDSWNQIKACDLMIATRLHAAVFACYAKVPFYLVEYHRKCTDFLNDIGHDLKYRIGDASFCINKLVQDVEDIMFNNEYRAPIYLDKTHELALLNFTSLIPFF